MSSRETHTATGKNLWLDVLHFLCVVAGGAGPKSDNSISWTTRPHPHGNANVFSSFSFNKKRNILYICTTATIKNSNGMKIKRKLEQRKNPVMNCGSGQQIKVIVHQRKSSPEPEMVPLCASLKSLKRGLKRRRAEAERRPGISRRRESPSDRRRRLRGDSSSTSKPHHHHREVTEKFSLEYQPTSIRYQHTSKDTYFMTYFGRSDFTDRESLLARVVSPPAGTEWTVAIRARM